jgi:hypothetical protein
VSQLQHASTGHVFPMDFQVMVVGNTFVITTLKQTGPTS